jgi:hypothetical protein
MKRSNFPHAVLSGLVVTLVFLSVPATSHAQGGFFMGGGGLGGFGGGGFCGLGGLGGGGFGCGTGFMGQPCQSGWSQAWQYPGYTYQMPAQDGFVQPQAGMFDPYNTVAVVPSVPYATEAFPQTSVAVSYDQPQANVAENSAAAAVPQNGLPPVATASGNGDAGAANGANGAIPQRLVIQNPKGTNGPVHYLIDGSQHTLAAGGLEELTVTAPCVVEFDRGTGGATARYTLASGCYRFEVSDNGWELYSAAWEVTLDNSTNDAAFYYLRDGRQESVPARRTRKLSDKFPIQVSFDPGNGGEPARRTLDQNGCTYRVALRTDSDQLDLIPR